MSKSLGNVVDPRYLHAAYGADAVRFFLMREMVFGLDSNFSEETVVERINTDLANDLGNLFSRVMAMAHKYFHGVVPDGSAGENGGEPADLKDDIRQAILEFSEEMEGFRFHKAIASIWNLISKMNKYVVVTAPWELAKKETTRDRLATVIYNLLEGLRAIAGMIAPIMPDTSATMQRHLGITDENTLSSLSQVNQWGAVAPGTQLLPPVTLFPRIEAKNQKTPSDTPENQKLPVEKTALNLKPEISFDDVLKLDLRVGRVVGAETIPKANKLLKLKVELGEETRTIVAGIAKSYTPEAITGKQVIVVANLKPAKLMGVLSQGMLLAAVTDEGCAIATPEREMPSGIPVK
jgi:methionyl-tRNA synthetase